jgi:hypothetical protein
MPAAQCDSVLSICASTARSTPGWPRTPSSSGAHAQVAQHGQAFVGAEGRAAERPRPSAPRPARRRSRPSPPCRRPGRAARRPPARGGRRPWPAPARRPAAPAARAARARISVRNAWRTAASSSSFSSTPPTSVLCVMSGDSIFSATAVPAARHRATAWSSSRASATGAIGTPAARSHSVACTLGCTPSTRPCGRANGAGAPGAGARLRGAQTRRAAPAPPPLPPRVRRR